MKWKDFYLPIGIVLAFVLGFLINDVGTYLYSLSLHDIKLSHVIIFCIFIISGYQIKLSDFKFNRAFILTIMVGFTINLICAPFLAKLVTLYIPINESLKLGILTIACVPTTLASGITLTDVAKANVPWAIILTIVFNIGGIFVLPFTYNYVIGSNQIIDIDPIGIFKKLSLLVLLPAVIGYLIRLKKPGIKNLFIQYFQPTGIIIIVFCTVATGKDKISNLKFQEFIILIFTVIFIHLSLFSISYLYGVLSKIPKNSKRALALVASQKTLPLSLTLLLSFPASIASQAAIACLLFHLSQIFVDSFIAYRWGKSS